MKRQMDAMTVFPFLINIVLSLLMFSAGYYAWTRSKVQKNYRIVSVILMITGIVSLVGNGVTAIMEV